MQTIEIGADELILWLRKNGKTPNTPNDELGRKICQLICEKLNGELKQNDYPAYWAAETGDKHIEECQLPKTAAQYKVDVEMISEIYKEMDKWG